MRFTFAGHRLVQLTCNHAEKTDTVLCECGWQKDFISCGAAFDGWLLHYRITVESWPAEPVVPEREPLIDERCYFCNKALLSGEPCVHEEATPEVIEASNILSGIEFCDHFCCGLPANLCKAVQLAKTLAAAPRAAGGQREELVSMRLREAQYLTGALTPSLDDTGKKILSQRCGDLLRELLREAEISHALAAAGPQVEGGGKT